MLTAEQISEIVTKAVNEAVSKAFRDAGLSISEEDHVMEARRDFEFLRTVRKNATGAASKIGMAVILIIVSGLIGIVWQGFKAAIK